MKRKVLEKHAKTVGKPLVIYGTLMFFSPGHSALIYKVKNHPRKKDRVHGDGYVLTSVAVKYLGLGCFETKNSIYAPENPLNYDKTQEYVA